ncbi:MAG: anion permease [Caldisericaceae bacterium]
MGANDGGVLLGSIISSNFIHPALAVLLLFGSLFVAPFIFGTAVVKTLGTKIFPLEYMTFPILYGALIATLLWVVFAQRIKYPVSISYTFVGALVGGSLASKHYSHLNWTEALKVFGGLIASIIISFILGYLIVKLLNWFLRFATPKVSPVFKALQVLTSILLVMGYGANDAEKALSLVYMATYITKSSLNPNPGNPLVVFVLAIIFVIGTMLFGANSLTTSGFRLMKSNPKQVFLAQGITSLTVLAFARIGLPISSTETLNMGVVGIGYSEKPYSVKWNVVKNLLLTWVVTVPMSIILSAAVTFILEKII